MTESIASLPALAASLAAIARDDLPAKAARLSAAGDAAGMRRERLLDAATLVAARDGWEHATVERIAAAARLTRSTFYSQFDDREQCLLAVLERAVSRLGQVLAPAYARDGEWPRRLRRALRALLAFLDHDRPLARVLVVESLVAGPRVLAYRTRVLGEVQRALDDDGGGWRGPDRGRSPLTAEVLVGGAMAVLHARVAAWPADALAAAAADDGDLVDLVGPLMAVLVAPYHGLAAAARELRRPAARAPAPARTPREVALALMEDRGVRFTYRTLRIVEAVVAHPGSNNRELALAADIRDEGQVSKLLARLARLGLITNEHRAGGRRAPAGAHAWYPLWTSARD